MDDATCSVDGCERPVAYRTRRLCRKCYKRITRKSTKGQNAKPIIPDVVRFEARLSQAASGCWLWTGELNRPETGYPVFGTSTKKHVYAHRWSYEYHVASIPDGLQLDHLCRTPACVNPWHLEPVTPKVNMARGEYAQRTHCPQGHEYTPDNIYVRPTGRGIRICKACRRESNRKAALKRRARMA